MEKSEMRQRKGGNVKREESSDDDEEDEDIEDEEEEQQPQKDEESKKNLQNAQNEIKEKNNKISTLQWIIFFGIVVFSIVTIIAVVEWVNDNDDPLTNLNGDHVGLVDGDDEKGFMDEHESIESNAKILYSLPYADVMDKSVGICKDFYSYSCGKYNNTYNMVMNDLAVRDMFDAGFELTKIQNEDEEINTSLKMFMKQCISSLSETGNTNKNEMLVILKKVRMIASEENPLTVLHDFGLMPFAIYNFENGTMNWIPSPWLKEKKEYTKMACSFLANYHIVDDISICANHVSLFYGEINQIDPHNKAKAKDTSTTYSYEQVRIDFPLLLTSQVAELSVDHVIWSDLMLKHLYSMTQHPYFKLWLQTLVVLDASAVVSGLWTHDPLHSVVSYQLLKRNTGKNGNFHFFRHGFGIDALPLIHAVSNERAKYQISVSCKWLAGEMLPHELESVRSKNDGAKEVTKGKFDKAISFLSQTIQNSKIVHDTVKKDYIHYNQDIRLQLGFPGESITLKGQYLSFLDMLWDIRSQHMKSNIHLTWPATLHSTTCNAITLLNERLVIIPHCIYNAQWLEYDMYALLFHEIMHCHWPELMKHFGLSPSEMDFLQSKMKCYGINFSPDETINRKNQELFAYIAGSTLAYQLCISDRNCSTSDQLKNFLVTITQFFCENQVGQNVNPIYGNNKKIVEKILKNMASIQGVSPFNNQFWNCYYDNPCLYF